MNSTAHIVIAGFSVYTWFLIGLAVCLSRSCRLMVKYGEKNYPKAIQFLLIVKEAMLWPRLIPSKK